MYMQQEQLKLLRPQILVGSIGSIVFAIFCFYFLTGRVANQQALTVWSVSAITSASLNFYYAWGCKARNSAHFTRQLRTYSLLGFITGLIWSVPSLLIFNGDFVDPEQIFLLLFILIGLMGMGAAALGSVTAYLPMYYWSVLPFLGSLIAALILSDNQQMPLFYFGIMLAIYTASLCGFAYFIHRNIAETIHLRNQNIQLTEQYKQQKQQAEQANMAKSQFLASASHDLRQPLHAMGLLVDSLPGAKNPQSLDRITNALSRSTKALSDLLNLILDLSKIEAGALIPNKAPLPVQPLLDRLAIQLQETVENKGLTLRVRPCSAWVETDAAMLEQILLNLLTNAMKFTTKGSILLGCRLRGERLSLEVWDTGCGISPQEQQQIFQGYYQVPNRTDQAEQGLGLGLGLSIVQGLCKTLALPLTLDSKVDRGSVFKVGLPVVKQSAQIEPSDLRDNAALKPQPR